MIRFGDDIWRVAQAHDQESHTDIDSPPFSAVVEAADVLASELSIFVGVSMWTGTEEIPET